MVNRNEQDVVTTRERWRFVISIFLWMVICSVLGGLGCAASTSPEPLVGAEGAIRFLWNGLFYLRSGIIGAFGGAVIGVILGAGIEIVRQRKVSAGERITSANRQ